MTAVMRRNRRGGGFQYRGPAEWMVRSKKKILRIALENVNRKS